VLCVGVGGVGVRVVRGGGHPDEVLPGVAGRLCLGWAECCEPVKHEGNGEEDEEEFQLGGGVAFKSG